MRQSDLIAYARRDWALLAQVKAAHWARVKRRSGVVRAVRAGEELRQLVRRIHPEWPTEEDRKRDLATHARVAASLRRVASAGAR
ncbi:MAG: hypothetical protein ACRD3M_19095 [Thermoanaerobaculia bacterium]